MKQQEVWVIRTGTANIASVFAGLRRAGAEPRLTHDADIIRHADHVVLPGVGAFGASMDELVTQGLVDVCRERIVQNKALLAVCVGMQLLFESSTESPGARGIAAISGHMERFPNTVRVPQLGWNDIQASEKCTILQSGVAYFANSYRLATAPGEGWNAGMANHGGEFVAALERGNILLCQFHPELSGAYGNSLLSAWLKGAQSC